MYTANLSRFAVLSCLLSLTIAFAQEHNVTVVDTNPLISYEGTGTGDASICKVDVNGTIVSQPGCYFFPSNCTASVAMSQNLDHKAAASFTFKGSAVYINSALDTISPIYTVTLDGQSTDIDGVRPSLGFTCALLFSQTNLDPTIEHTITLSVKGPSPNRNITLDPNGTSQVFSLIDFIYTVPDSGSNSSSASAGVPLSSPTTGTGAAAASLTSTSTIASNSTPKTNGAADARAPSILLFGMLQFSVWAVLGAGAVSIY